MRMAFSFSSQLGGFSTLRVLYDWGITGHEGLVQLNFVWLSFRRCYIGVLSEGLHFWETVSPLALRIGLMDNYKFYAMNY